jgi:hypothetical protein
MNSFVVFCYLIETCLSSTKFGNLVFCKINLHAKFDCKIYIYLKLTALLSVGDIPGFEKRNETKRKKTEKTEKQVSVERLFLIVKFISSPSHARNGGTLLSYIVFLKAK